LQSDSDLGLDRIIIGAHTVLRRIEQAGRQQSLNVRVHVAVVAPQRLGQRTHTRHFVPAYVTQQLHALSGQDTDERIPTLERQKAFLKFLAALGAMPGVDKAPRGFSPRVSQYGAFPNHLKSRAIPVRPGPASAPEKC
jgi:hypothetical protein